MLGDYYFVRTFKTVQVEFKRGVEQSKIVMNKSNVEFGR